MISMKVVRCQSRGQDEQRRVWLAPLSAIERWRGQLPARADFDFAAAPGTNWFDNRIFCQQVVSA
jgi:hypothetical protein